MIEEHAARGSHASPGSGAEIRLYAVDNIIFRVALCHLEWRAEALSKGAWREIPLTGQEVIDLLGARQLAPEEAAALPA